VSRSFCKASSSRLLCEKIFMANCNPRNCNRLRHGMAGLMSRPFRAPECVWRRYLGLRSTATAVSLTPGWYMAHRWCADPCKP
jgi:hypothetical protein